MRRVIVIAAAGIGLAGCSSFSWDAFKATPPTVQVQLESTPPGADATTSLGPACTLNRFQPVTIAVQVIRDPSAPGSTTLDPNPVVAELQPAGPPPKAARKHVLKPKPKPPATAAAPAGSAFPAPAATPASR